jgi:hypothetical protein
MIKQVTGTCYRVLREKLRRLCVAIRTWLLRTDARRWRKVATEVPAWDGRNRLIADLIPFGSSVLDLGAGAQTLAGYLKAGCQYQPCDCVRSSDNVWLCDFNRDRYLAVRQRFDYVVVSGLLEYIHDPRKFLGVVRSYGNILLVSYADSRPSQTRFWRASQGWVNHLSRSELERIFEDIDLGWQEVAQWHEQIIYRVQPKSL